MSVLLPDIDDKALSPEQRRQLADFGDDKVLHYLAERGPTRSGSPSSANMVRIATSCSLASVTSRFKALERAGCGNYKVGRRGKESRFHWRCSPKSVLAMAQALSDFKSPAWLLSCEAASKVGLTLSESGEGSPRVDPTASESSERSPKPEPTTPENGESPATEPMLEHTYRLRPNLPVALWLPTSFTRAEAARLASFITSLPFGE